MKLRVRFLQLPILFDAARLAQEVAAIPESAWRPHPQGYPGNDGNDPNGGRGEKDGEPECGQEVHVIPFEFAEVYQIPRSVRARVARRGSW